MMGSISWPTPRKCHLGSKFEDRTSILPDEIIVSIISHLNLLEAARTSVLSRRWRYLWTYTTGILDFVKSIDLDDGIHNYEQLKSVEVARCRFIEWVSLVLNLHKSSTIDEFRVCFDLEEGSSNAINSWIKFALKRRVKRLVLDFGCFYYQSRHYTLRTQVFSNCSLGSMTALHLVRVDVTGEVVEYILSSFPLLQQLRLRLSFSLVDLKIAGSLPHLTCLEIKDCRSMRSLEVHAVNIVSFGYRGPKISIYFKEIPHLIEADLDKYILKKYLPHLSNCFSQLESLVFDYTTCGLALHENERDFPKLPSFEKLKQLEASFSGITVDYYVRWCTKLLKASPSLHRFVLKIQSIPGFEDGGLGTPRRKVKYQHKQLKVVEFIGFLGHDKDFEIVIRLLRKLPSLQKVVIDPRPICELRNCRGRYLFDRNIVPMHLGNPTANVHLLQNFLPPGAELVLVPHSNYRIDHLTS